MNPSSFAPEPPRQPKQNEDLGGSGVHEKPRQLPPSLPDYQALRAKQSLNLKAAYDHFSEMDSLYAHENASDKRSGTRRVMPPLPLAHQTAVERRTNTTVFARERPFEHRVLPPLPLREQTAEEAATNTRIYARGNQHPVTRPLPLPKTPSPVSEGRRTLPSFPEDANVIHRDAMDEKRRYQEYLTAEQDRQKSHDRAFPDKINAAREQALAYRKLKAEARKAIEAMPEVIAVMNAAIDQVQKTLGNATSVMRKFETFEAPAEEMERLDSSELQDWDQAA